MVMHNIIVCDDRPSPPGGVKLCAAVQLGASPGGPPHGGAGEAGNACVNCTSRTFPACVSIDPEPKAIPALPSRANRLSAWPCSGTRRCLRVQSLGMPQLTLCRRHRRGPAPSVVAVVWCAAPGRKTPPPHPPPGRWWELLTGILIDICIYLFFPGRLPPPLTSAARRRYLCHQ